VLASEMECAQLFALRAVWEGENLIEAQKSLLEDSLQVGAVLSIVGDDSPFADKRAQAKAVDETIAFALALAAKLDSGEYRK
jgi:hypothetical protein